MPFFQGLIMCRIGKSRESSSEIHLLVPRTISDGRGKYVSDTPFNPLREAQIDGVRSGEEVNRVPQYPASVFTIGAS
jgi:hypothetical protein